MRLPSVGTYRLCRPACLIVRLGATSRGKDTVQTYIQIDGFGIHNVVWKNHDKKKKRSRTSNRVPPRVRVSFLGLFSILKCSMFSLATSPKKSFHGFGFVCDSRFRNAKHASFIYGRRRFVVNNDKQGHLVD